MLYSHHLIPQHRSHPLFLLLMDLLVKYPRPLSKLLPNRSWSRIPLSTVHLKTLRALVKPQRCTLSNLPQQTNPRKEKRKEKAKLKSMPWNRVLPNCFSTNHRNGSLSLPTSFARRIIILRIVHDDPKLVDCSRGPLLSSKSLFCLSRLKW